MTWMSSYKLTQILLTISILAVILQMNLKDACILGVVGVASWYITYVLIPKVQVFMIKKEIFGLDINKIGSKAGQKKIPQCMGFAAAVSFCIIGMILTPYFKLQSGTNMLITHLAIFVTVLSTILLGFADDMLDLLWRYKLIFPFFIIIPLVSVYSGPTHVNVIYPFTLIFGNKIQLGVLFHVYITFLGIYKTNTINIYAGINGLEVGQSIVAAAGMLLYFATDIFLHGHAEKYTYSSLLLICFLGTAIALMKLNAYPSHIFIGDTFCYFAGIILAIAAIYGQIPIVCHWFVFPQLINFLYSTPQLFGIVPCPRHRLTKYDPKTDTLSAISTNMNLLNLSLRVLGPTNEGKLCLKLLILQILFVLIPIIHLLLTQ